VELIGISNINFTANGIVRAGVSPHAAIADLKGNTFLDVDTDMSLIFEQLEKQGAEMR
jgi:hypothetical protein